MATTPTEESEIFLVTVQVSGPSSVVARNLRYAKQNVRRVADALAGDVTIAIYNPDGSLDSATIMADGEAPPDHLRWEPPR